MTSSIDRLLFGTDEPVPETILLHAGPLTLQFRGGRLWHLALGGCEVWHGVAFLFRDPDWGTPEPVIERCETTIGDRWFSIRCSGRFPTSPQIDFTVDIGGSEAGVVRFTGLATPRDDIRTNRIGLCVMHPMSAAGCSVEIGHVDGRSSRSTLPVLIPPWPPFMLIRSIRHEYATDRWARCALDGDAFELEDQRNNSDASFKTYSRSNMMPRPYWLRAGVPIRQSVELSLEAPVAAMPSPPRQRSTIVVRVGAEIGDLPPVGIEISPRDIDAHEATRAALCALRPAHLHLALEPQTPPVDWTRMRSLLEASGAQLRLDVGAADVAQAVHAVNTLGRELADAGVVPESLAVFPSEQRAIDAARVAFPHSFIGGGTPHFFVQLNRLEGLGSVDFATFTTSPIVHGADDESVMLSLQSLPSMVETLAARYPGLAVHVGPSAIAARRSPLGAQPDSDGTKRIALARRDPRSRGLYGAAWVLGYAAQLAVAGVGAMTLMNLREGSGILPTDADALPYPAHFVLQCLQRSSRMFSVSVSEPTRVAALALGRGVDKELLLCNLTRDELEIEIEDGTKLGDVRVLDARSYGKAATSTDVWRVERRSENVARLGLGPYAIARTRDGGG